MFVIEKDMGMGNAPAFFGGIPNGTIRWGLLSQAATFKTEEEAQAIIDGYDDMVGCIAMPYDEEVFKGTGRKSAEVLNNMELDTNQDKE